MNAKLVIITARKRSRAPTHRSVGDGHALLAPDLGEFDDQDAVLGGERNQHDETDLRIEIVVEPGDQQRQHGASDSDRNREEYGNRDGPALVEPDQEQECEQDGERQDHAGLA